MTHRPDLISTAFAEQFNVKTNDCLIIITNIDWLPVSFQSLLSLYHIILFKKL